jgi:ABC-type transport system substrate-binding protein
MPAPVLQALAFLALVPGLAGCGGGPEADAPVRVLATRAGAAETAVAEATGVGLTQMDARARVIPGLAQSWRVSNDGSFIVFRLRDAQGPGGRPLVADDVVRAIQAVRQSAGRPDVRALLAGIREVRAPLPEVVEIRLSTPQPEFLALLAQPDLAIRPRRSVRRRIPAMPGPMLAAGGEASAGVAQLQANPDFFAPGSVPARHIRIATDPPDAAIASFGRGEAELVLGDLLAGNAAARVLAPRNTLRRELARATLFIAISHRAAPLDDARVRVALSMAVDRDRLGRELWGSTDAVPLVGLTPPGLAHFQPPPPPAWAGLPIAARRAQARRLLLDAGHGPLDAKLRLKLATGDSPEEARLARLLAEDWATIGIDLVVERRTAAAQARVLAAGDHQLAIDFREGVIDSPLPFLLPLMCRANPLGLCNSPADDLVRQSWQAPTLAARMEALANAERMWIEDGALVPLAQPLRWMLVRPDIQGVEPNAAGIHPLRLVHRDD